MKKSSKKNQMDDRMNDSFRLYDLKVEVVGSHEPMVCHHRVGDYFIVQGENLVFKTDQSFSMYALAAILPLLPAKQRGTDPNDWMTTDAEIACPDPHCGGRFKITRLGLRTFSHSGTTGLPDQRGVPYWKEDEPSHSKGGE